MVRLLPVKFLLVILFAAVAYIFELLLIKIIAACLCAGLRWREIVLYSDNEDELGAMACERSKILGDGLRQACGRGCLLHYGDLCSCLLATLC